jgi:hypothetical protein
MFRNLHFAAALSALSACVPEVPEGVLRCDPLAAAASNCPKGWYCHPDARCYGDPPLALEVDASSSQATGDGGRPSADVDAGSADRDSGPDDVDPQTDAEVPDASDASAQPDTSVPVTCRLPSSGIVCNDDIFCNGAERCDADNPLADARGCVAGPAVTCPAGQSCSEKRAMCSACSDVPGDNDNDGDTFQAASCGGDDCDDNDAARRPGQPESCDMRDNDCDGTVDGAPADMACMQMAPMGATSRCMNGSCMLTSCSDPDFDLVNGACVRHDDCAGNPCGPAGMCTDGNRSFTCTCPAGYTGTGTTACKDIDECTAPVMHNCVARATCVNKEGGFTCRCPDGFVGTGIAPVGCTRPCRDRPRCQDEQ